jgi:hypothetical protein
VVVAVLSSVPFPLRVERSVYPDPAAVTSFVDSPAPKRRSFGAVVVTGPLFIAAPEPVAAAVASTGEEVLIPEYSVI